MKIRVYMKDGLIVQGEVLRYNYINGWVYLLIKRNHFIYRLEDTLRTVIIHG